jgi:DMSO/TMAO reductase YedYZ heme-binding membrane subunit
VQATSLARRRLPHRLWRRVHLGAFPLFATATVHLLTAGSDRATLAVVAMLVAAVASTTFLLLFRLLHQPRHIRPARPGPRAAATARAGRTPANKAPRPAPAPDTTPAQ